MCYLRHFAREPILSTRSRETLANLVTDKPEQSMVPVLLKIGQVMYER